MKTQRNDIGDRCGPVDPQAEPGSPEDADLDRRVADAIAVATREHLASATRVGRIAVSGFINGFDEPTLHVFLNDQPLYRSVPSQGLVFLPDHPEPLYVEHDTADAEVFNDYLVERGVEEEDLLHINHATRPWLTFFYPAPDAPKGLQ